MRSLRHPRITRTTTTGATVTAVVSLLLGACGGGSGTATPPVPGGSGSARLEQVAARLTRVAGVAALTAMAVRAGDDAVYVTEKGGRVRALSGGQGASPALVSAPVLELSGDVSGAYEQGLLGLTFSPDGNRLYVDYTDTAGDTQVVEYAFRDGRADPGSRRPILSVDQPFANHNGGEVVFGPDGMLYVGLGDGGSQRDPANRAQNLGTLLGKILRIDPRASDGQPYTVPADNPFVGRSGARPEIWASGLRNPWRFTWDRETRDLWVADVGQTQWEEIDFVPAGQEAGANFGWSQMDSRHRLKGDNPPGAILPLFEYTHDGGNCSIVGGYVYRGTRIRDLGGAYVYGDTCSGRIWALTQENGRVDDQRELDLEGGGDLSISSFGEDAAGELYVLDLNGAVYRMEPA